VYGPGPSSKDRPQTFLSGHVVMSEERVQRVHVHQQVESFVEVPVVHDPEQN
jgi:hypothetical protein